MFCIYCGKEIPDGTVCECRKNPVSAPDTQAPAADAQAPADNGQAAASEAPYGEFTYNPNPAPDNNYNNVYNNNFNNFNNVPGQTAFNTPYSSVPLSERHAAIKKIMASPLALIAAILYSVGTVCSVFNGFNISIFSILTLVALWVTYSAAKKDAPLKASGFTIASGLTIAQIVLMSVAYASIAAVLVLFACMPGELAEAYPEAAKYIGQAFDITMPASIDLNSAIFIILLIVWTCMFIFIVFYYATLRSSIVSVRSELNNETPKHKINMFPLIILILSSVMSIANSVYTIINIDHYADMFNNLLNSSLASAGINYKINISFGIIGPIGSLCVAVSMIFIAVLFIRIRNNRENAW